MKEYEKLWKLWEEFKERAEQHDFPKILFFDLKLMPFHNDLKENYSKEHEEIFCRIMRNNIFPFFGIKEIN